MNRLTKFKKRERTPLNSEKSHRRTFQVLPHQNRQTERTQISVS